MRTGRPTRRDVHRQGSVIFDEQADEDVGVIMHYGPRFGFKAGTRSEAVCSALRELAYRIECEIANVKQG